MIPLHLQIKNFLSYGPHTQSIDFSSHHLICLAGKNGHGKSAIIDAMTWAVWASARKTSGATKADDGILRIGQTHMMVIFEFMCHETRYRVRREYIRNTQRGETRLYFGMYDPQEDRYRSLTETTTKETQHVIQQVVGLDYEAFIHSVCIRQGQSNAFSRKSPKERKEILARILDLEQYERYKKHAQEQMKQIDAQIEQTHAWCQQLESDIAQKAQLQEQHTSCKDALEQLQKQEHDLRTQDQRLYESDNAYAQQQTHLEQLRQQHRQLQNYYAEQHKQMRSLVAAWRSTFRDVMRSRNRNIHKEYEETKKYVQHLSQQRSTAHDAYERMQHAQQAAQNRKNALYREFLNTAHHAQHQVAQLSAQLQEIQAKLTSQREHLSASEQRYAELHHKYYEASHGSQTSQPKLERAHATLEKRIHQLGRLVGTERILSAQQYHAPSDRYNHTRQRIHRSQGIVEQHISHARKELDDAYTEYAAQQQHYMSTQHLEEQLHEYLSAILQRQASCNTLITHYNQISTSYAEWQAYAQQYQHESSFDRIVQHDETYQQHAREIEKWHAIMHKNTVSAETYDAAYKKLEELHNQRDTIQSGTTEVQNERRHHIHTLINNLKKLKSEGRDIKEHITAYPDLESKRSEIHAQRQKCAQELTQIQNKKEAIIQQKGAITQQLDSIKQKETTYSEKQQHLEQLRQQRTEYVHIAQAFSRDGIQALLIEHAIPEIEQEANALLRELTDNQSQLIIESLRDLKSGKTKETLDIKISDNMGIRSYELFSGGEAFRIDFALRVAISTLLARRAGTQLQTLIIDEGFGSQDEEGLHHIMDAIHRIQNHFAKIIIVSHLPELKDQFPAQFIVHKGPHGSSVDVHTQG